MQGERGIGEPTGEPSGTCANGAGMCGSSMKSRAELGQLLERKVLKLIRESPPVMSLIFLYA